MAQEEKFIPYQYEVLATVKLTILCDEEGKLEQAIQEMNENLSSSDLISAHGCIVKGRVIDHKISKEA